ncbi:Gamma-tubulin complex component 2 [Phytophthora cactorum]|nr:Gamma-tubulin complex component 2 [Phytophthora cactorum]
MQDEPPPPPPPPPVDSRSRSLSSNPAVPGPLRAGGRAPTFSELRASGLSSRSSSLHVDVKDDDPLSPRTRLEMEKQRQAMGKTTATSSGLNTSAANTSNTTPTNHSSTRSTPRSSSFYSVSSSLEFAPTGGRRFDLQTQHRNPSNQLSPHRAMLSRVDSLLGSQPPSGPSPGASSQYGGASFVATHSMYSASSTSTSPSLATSTRTFHRERGEEQREPSSCGAEILYNSPIRLRLSSRQCLRISAVKDSNHQSHATSHFPPRPTGSGTGTGGSAGIARTSRPLTTVQINVSGDGLDGDADQIFVLQNTALRSDCGEVHYSDIVSLYCVGGSCKGQFLSVDPATQTLTMKKGPVISNSEKWRLVNPISEGREDYPVNNQDSFASVDAASRLWGQQKAIATSDSVMLKMNTAELYLSVRPDRYGQDDSAGTHTASVVLSKENDGINDTMQVWKVTKSNLPYDPEWNRERPYLTGEAFVQPQAKRHHTADDGDLNLPPLSTYPPSVQESIIVDDLLYVLLGVEGRYIKLAVTETRGVDAARSTRTFKFGLNQPGMDPSLLTLASRCLSLGEFYLNLSLYIEQFSRYEYGQVSHAFCAALKTLVKEYKIMVGQLEHLTRNADGAAPFTIQKLWYNVQPSLRTLEMLSLLVDGCHKTIGGGSLLSEIQRIMSSLAGDSNARKVFSFLMERASVPYLKMVERWIYHGDLVDPYDEFMIRRDDQVSKEDVQDNPYSTYWQSRYTIRASQVPLFLSRVAQKILTAGKYLNVFRTCSRQVDCPFAGEIVFSPSESVYEELIDKAHGFASWVLLDLFVRENDLQNRLISLKHYFLMDQGDFFVDFMDVAEVELKLRADKLSLPRLESLLHLSLQTSTCSSDPYKDDLQCFLSPHNLISHMEAIHQRAQKGPRDSLTTFESSSIGHPGYKVIDAFTLDYNVKWPLSLVISCGALTKYQMIFRHIFFCKHVERQLCDAWMNHQATKELSLRAALGPSFCLRQRMLHFQQNFVYYMMFEVISPRWHDFQQQLASAGTVDDILEFQGEFLDICLKECLLTDPELLRVLTRLMMVCMTFANSIESYTRPYFLDEETIKAEREAERDRRAEKKAREEAEVALASYQRQKGTFGGKKKGGVLRRRQSSQVDMRRTRIRELSDDVKRALTEREGDEENPFVRMTNDLENQFDSLLGEFMQQLLRRSLLQQNSHLSNLCTRLDYNGFYTKRAQYTCVLLVAVCLLLLGASAKQLTVLVQPLTSTAGESLSVQPVLALTDDNGNILTTENDGTVIVSIGNNPSRFAETSSFDVVVGPSQLREWWTRAPAALLNVSIVGGIARFRGAFIDVAGSPYKLRYTTDLVLDGGSTVVTNPFTVAAGECSRLQFNTTLGEATGGKAFLIQPVLKLLDSADGLTVRVQKGVATFRSLKIDKAGNGYSLQFTLYTKVQGKNTWKKTTISQVSDTFDILTGNPVSLLLQRNLSDGILDGQPNEIQPIVALLDSGGNVVSSLETGTVTASLVSSASVSSSIVVDTSAAPLLTVVNVRALINSAYPMAYGVGARVSVQVTFSDEVSIKGAPTLELESSANGAGANGKAVAVTTTTVWSSIYVFEYDVVATDNTLDLEYTSTTALSLNGGLITDRNGKTPILTLPALGSANSLAGTSAVVIDTTAPVITSVSCPTPGDGEYGTGQQINLSVQFSQPVSVYGNPLLPVALTSVSGTGGTRNAVFSSGNNTNTLVFIYTVQSGDAAAKLDVTASINVNGGFIKHCSQRPTTDAVVTMAAVPVKLSSVNNIVIDTATPTIDATVGVTSGTSNGIYAPGDEIKILITFTKPVTVTGYPRLFLETGPIRRPAGYTTGSGTKVLTLVYRVSAGDTAGNGFLNYRDDHALRLNGGTITRSLVGSTGATGVSAVLSLTSATSSGKALANNAQLTIDGLPPTVTRISVSSAPSSTVTRGNEVVIGISFSALVTVDTTKGTPTLQMDVGSYNRQAVYKSGSGSQSLLFSYIVSLGDTAPNGVNYRSRSALVLNGATIRRASNSPTLDAYLMLPDPPSLSPQIIVDRALSSVTTIKKLSADVVPGTYGTKQVITLSLTFSDEVALSGIMPPALKINTGTVVPYASGSSTRTLVFLHIVKNGEAIPGLDKFDDNAVICTAPNCQIINYNAQSADLSLTGISLEPANIVIDTSAPQIVSVYAVTTAPTVNGGSFVVGDVIEIVIKMDLEVFIEPPPSAYPEKAPVLLLNTVKGGKPVLCQGYANNDRHLLLFKYTVEPGDVATDLMHIDQSALTLNSGQSSIKRFSTTPTTNAVLTLPVPQPLGASLNVNGNKVPAVLSVSSPTANDLYRCGDQIALTVSFSQHVVVKGAPFLWLDMGAVPRKALYNTGSGTTVLTFIYTVQEGDYSVDMEYVDHHSLDSTISVNGTTPTAILHLSTNPTTVADVNLPYPFTQGSLSYNKNLQVNGRKPSIVATRFTSADGLYKFSDTVVMEVTFSACVVIDRGPLGAQGPTPRLRFKPSPVSSFSTSTATTITRYGVYVGGSPGTALRFEYTIKTGDTALGLDYAGTTALELNGARILTCTANANVAATQSVDLHLNPPGGRLLGDTAKPVVFGRATFTDLVVDRLGFDYRVNFSALYNQTALETSAYFDMLSSAVYGLRSSPYASGDRLGSSVDVDGDTLVLGGPGASQPVAAVQIVTALGDAETFVNEIQVLQTTAKQQPAVQILTSTAAPGETIGGFFYLKLGSIGPTRRLPYNADPTQMSVALEMDLGFGLQTISVTREPNTYCACSNGYVWHITFLFAEGPVDALTVASSTQLTGRSASIGDGRLGSAAVISVPSTTLGGTMTLQLGNFITRNIKYNVDEAELAIILTQDLHLNVWSVSRSLPSAMDTYTWRVTFTASDTLYNVPQLLPQGVLLTGYGAGLTVRTERDGQGRLSGFFRLQFRTDIFPNDETDDIPVGASDHDVEVALEKLVNAKNDYGPVIDTSGNLPALVPVITKLKGTNARVVVQVGGYEPSSLSADSSSTNAGLPGGSAGMAAVFTRGNNDWKQQGGTIAGHDTRGGDLFGSSVSLQGNTLLVGAPAAAIFGIESGCIRCKYARTAIRDRCSHIGLTLRAGDHGDDSGNIPDLVVDSSALTKGAGVGSAQMHEYSAGTFRSDGSSAKGLQCGAAYIFTRDKKLSTWSEYTKFAPPAAQIADIREYGGAVALSDPFAVVGAPGAYNEAGRVFVYQFNGVDKWLLFQTLSAAPNVITSGDRFGESVAISGTVTTTVVVGAPGYASNSGAVFVFDLMGGYFQNRQMLMQVVPEMQPGDGFGNALDLDMLFTYTLVVAAHRHTYQRDGAVDAVKSGMVLVFVRRSSNDIFFVLQQVLYASDIRARDRFGTSIAVAKDTIIVGAHELYEGEQTTRKAVQALTASVLETEATNSIQGGSFTLSFLRSNAGEDPTKVTTIKRVETRAIAYDISSSGLQAILETDFDLTNVIVRRDGPSAYKGYTWYVTFAGSSGEIPLLEVDNTQLKGGEVTVKWINHLAPVLRGSAYVFTRDGSGKWTEQASFFPRKKQYFAWFGSAVAVHKRTAVIGAPNLDTYISGINSGGAFVGDLGILSVRFSAKTYNVLEGDSLDVTVQRCSRLGGFCAVDVSAAPQLYIEYDTGDAFSDRQSASTYVAVIPTIGPYRKLSSLDASGRQGSSSVFYAKDVMGQEPFPQVGNGRWLAGDAVGTANGRNQFYGSSERRSLWVDAIFDYAGTSDYSSSSGELFFDGVDDLTHTFSVQTTSDFVVENPDETVMMRLSLPGIWPSVTGDLWSTLTIKDNGDGGSGARSYLAHLNPEPSLAQAQSDFSRSVSIFNAGNAAAVGAPLERNNAGVKCGAVHLFVRRSGFWERDATVFPSDCVPGMLFGTSVAIDGSLGPVRAIVGAPGADAAYIYLYRRDGLTPAARWMEETRLDEPTLATDDINHNYAGSNAVTIFGDIAVVGASGLERVYVYHRGVDGLWKLVSTLRASDRVQYQILERAVEQSYAFGHAMDMDKRTIIVGAPFSDAGVFTAQQYHSADFDRRYFAKGAAYVFHLEAQEQRIMLRTSNPLISGSFRLAATRRGITGITRAISYSATGAEVKAALEGTNGQDGDGSTIEALGFRLLEVQRTGSIDQGFTWSVTFIGEIVTVPLMTASWFGYGCSTCKAFSSTFIPDPTRQILISEVVAIGSGWKQQARLTAPDGNAGDQFGLNVGLSGEQAIVGAAGSSALTTTTWDFETGDLTGASPPGQRANHEGRYWVGTFEARPGAGKATTAAQVAAQMCAFTNDELCRAPNYKMPTASASVGTTQGDGPQGTLTSLPFIIEGQWMSFRVGGGCDIRVVYVELLIDGQPAAVSESVAAEQVAVEVTADGASTPSPNNVRPITATSKLRATGRCRETMQEVTWDLSAFENRTAQIRVVDASSNLVWGHINFDDVRFSWGAARVAQTSTSKAGAAYTFRRRAPGTQFPTAKCEGMNRWTCEWEFQARLAASDKRSEDLFGSSVAVDDVLGVAVVAAPGQRGVDANNTIDRVLSDGLDISKEGLRAMEQVGSLYVFRRADELRDGAGVLLRTPKWAPKEVLKMQYPQKQRQSHFGAALDLDGSDLIVGAPGISISPVLPQSGRAFAYDLAVAGIKFTNSWFACVEGNADGLVGLTLSRSAATSNLTRPLTIGYATEDRSAVGVDALKFATCMKVPSTQRKDCGDYQQIAGEVTFAAGETSKLVTIPIMEDMCLEQWEKHFVVRLQVPGGEPLLGEDFIARVRIDDDDFNSEPC